ncbi:MAG TPA: hypothetical protein VGM29_00755 [Polyangiaceae bacterium]|jgi:hypothetical protein
MSPLRPPFEQDSIDTLPAPPERPSPIQRQVYPIDPGEFEEEIPTVVRVRKPGYVPPPSRPPAS